MLNSPDRISTTYAMKDIGNAKIKSEIKNRDVEKLNQKQKELRESINILDDFLQKGNELASQLSSNLITILANTQLVFLMIGKEDLRKYLTFVEDAARESEDMLQKFREFMNGIADLQESQKED